ncbi:MAG TPA: hypothetical protein VFB50_09240 [Chloroflexota bacterium]|nr:hypothetical protein [Chloroflexota bacterium]
MSVVHPPDIVEDDLGPAGWRIFHELADLRGRHPRKQVLALLRYALYQAIAGEDVELTRSQLESLFANELTAA